MARCLFSVCSVVGLESNILKNYCHSQYTDNVSLRCVFSGGFEEQLKLIMTCHSRNTVEVSL